MRTTPLIPFLLLALTACSAGETSISEQNANPLTASRYGDELADTMADFIIGNDPAVVNNPDIRAIVESEIERGKDIAAAAREIHSESSLGAIIGIKSAMTGFALYHKNTFYLSSDFSTSPGASLHVYLTTVVDPRDTDFPDSTAIDLGALQAVYGPQQYSVPSQKEEDKLRTFVLFDTKLKMVYGFAQISKR